MAEREFEFEFHPAANLLPLLEGREFDRLVTDIRIHGLREPITLLEDTILDGRNRYRACRAAGVELHFEQWTPRHNSDTPVAFVLSRNLERRHLNQSQRAMVAARLANPCSWPRQERAKAASLEAAKTQVEAAKLLGVGRPSVQRAAVVLKKGAPQLAAAVERGLIPVSIASKLAALPWAEQVKVASDEDPPRAARRVLQPLGLKPHGSRDIDRLIAQLTVELEKIPSAEMTARSLLVDSYGHREQLAKVMRLAGDRLVELANQIEEPNFCAYKNCHMGFRGSRKKHPPGEKYCGPRCAEIAVNDRSAWKGGHNQ